MSIKKQEENLSINVCDTLFVVNRITSRVCDDDPMSQVDATPEINECESFGVFSTMKEAEGCVVFIKKMNEKKDIEEKKPIKIDGLYVYYFIDYKISKMLMVGKMDGMTLISKITKPQMSLENTKFNLWDFNNGNAFKSKYFDKRINSDHAAIRVLVKNNENNLFVVQASNVNKISAAPFFGPKYGTTYVDTHFFVEAQNVNSSETLQTMKNTQIDQIVCDLKTGKNHIQVISEGDWYFLSELKEKLNDDFRIVSVAFENRDYEKKTWNATAIVINLSIFKLLKKEIISKKYSEEGNETPQDLIIPHVTVRHNESCEEFEIFGLHLPGCSSQYPKGALKALEEILSLYKLFNVIAMGDTNTPPVNLEKSLGKSRILTPLYLTHGNPKNQFASYDNTIYNVQKDITLHYDNVANLPLDSFLFVRAIYDTIKDFQDNALRAMSMTDC